MAIGQLAQLYLDLGEVGEARRLLQLPQAAQYMPPIDFHVVSGRVAWSYGDYDAALKHHMFVGEFLRDDAVTKIAAASRLMIMGGDSELTGSSLRQVYGIREGLSSAEQRAELLINMGVIALEAGRTQEAAGYFKTAVEQVNPRTPSRSLAGRYYHLITNQWLSD
jgi:tetratricopeptide (TPR) repeat protein